MTTTNISIYRGLKSTYNPDNHIGFYITTDTNELLLNSKSLGQAIVDWELNEGILYLNLNTGKTITIPFPDATSTTRGLMTSEDYVKLSELPNSSEIQQFINEAIENYAIPEYVTNHIQDTNNPHLVTKSQLGLGNVDNTSDINKPISIPTQAALNKKVDKEDGKVLSSNDYTNEDKLKLQGIEEGAQVNTVTSVAGKTGAVVLSKSDVGLNLVDNTSDINKPVSIPQQEAINAVKSDIQSFENSINNNKQELITIINNTKQDLIGTLEDNSDSNTINGAKKYAESIIPTIELDSTTDLQYELKVDGQIIGTINIPEDQFLEDVQYNSNIITFTFKTSNGQKTTEINVSDLIDTYNAGQGIILNDSTFSIKIDPVSDTYLSVSENGLKLSGINSELNKINSGLSDVNSDISDINSNISTIDSELNKINSDLLEINSDISEINSDVSNIKSDILEINSDVSNINSNISNINSELNNKINRSDVYTKLEIDSKNFATETYVNNQIADAITSGTIDLSDYLTINNANLTYATKQELNSSNDRISTLEAIDHDQFLTEHQSLENYYTKEQTDLLVNSVEIPTRTSQLTNDSGFISDASNFATKEDITGFATKEQIANLATKDDISGLATKEDVANIEIPSTEGLLSKDTADILYQNKGEYLTPADLNSVNDRLQSLEAIDHSQFLTEHQSLENYYIKSEVDTKIADAVTGGTVDLSNYYTKSESDSKYLTEHQSLDGYAKIQDIPSVSVSSTDGNIITINNVDNKLVNATTESDGEMSKEDKAKLDTIESNAQVNVQSDWNAIEGDSFIQNKPTNLSQFNEDSEHRLVTDAEKDTWNNKQDLISDLEEIRTNSTLGSTALQEETDPTVPSWAKQETKPTYTKEEIGLGNVDNVSSTQIKQDIIGLESDLSDQLTLHGIKKYAESVSSGVNNYTVNGKSISTNPVITKEDVELGNVTNESKQTMFTSPEFTGTPTAPTANNGTNTTQIATTAFVQNQLPIIATSNKEGLVKSALSDSLTSNGVDRYVEVLEDGRMKVNVPNGGSSVNSIVTWGAGIDSSTPTNQKHFMKVENDDGTVTFHKMFSALVLKNRGRTVGYYNPALATTDSSYTNQYTTLDITDDFSDEKAILRPTVLYSTILAFDGSGWEFMNPTRALDDAFIYHKYSSNNDCHVITYSGNRSTQTDNGDGTIHLVSYTSTISSVIVTPIFKNKNDSEFNKYDIIVKSYWGSSNEIYIYYRDRATGNILTDLNVSDAYLQFSITFLGYVTKTESDISKS